MKPFTIWINPLPGRAVYDPISDLTDIVIPGVAFIATFNDTTLWWSVRWRSFIARFPKNA